MSELYAMVLVVGSSAITALVSHFFARRENKSSKKTEMRAQAYVDFVMLVSKVAVCSRSGGEVGEELLSGLAAAKTRIAIYGDSKVVRCLAEFDREFRRLDSEEAYDAFTRIVREMRVDAIGFRSSDDNRDLKRILFDSDA